MPEGLSRIGFALAAVVAAVLGALVFAPGRAEAAITSCTMTATSVVFSPYNTQTKAAVDSTGTLDIQCTGTGSSNAASVHINFGVSGGGTCTTRRMANGANRLNYQIYQNSGRTTNFCNGSNRLNLNFNLSTGSQTQTVTMYGRVAAAQNPVYAPTPYTDTLTIDLRAGTGGTILRTTTTTISSMVAAICTVSAGTLGFGAYSGSQVDSTAAVSVNCSNGAPYAVALGGGGNQSGSTRRMAGPGANRLDYQLFRDSARAIPWGDDSAQLGARRAGTGAGSAQALTVYGRIPAAQSPAPGSYSDSVVVTVEY
ncbi:MAG TPA: spore coat U domain-containing protein [Allosphingosinicella sp.]|nr:spore coat U domain-containing protein [Allosphingosinicella sp.]